MRKYQLIAADSMEIPTLSSIGYSDDPLVTRFGPSVRGQYIIHYVLSGKGYFNGARVEAGQGFLITPGCLEEYYPDSSDPWSFLWIISEDGKMADYFTRYRANSDTGVFTFHDQYAIDEIAERVRRTDTGVCSSSELAELFLRIFNLSTSGEGISDSGMTSVYFRFSENYVKSNLHMPLTVRELCSAIGITQPYLYRIFKQYAGMSPKRYIMESKLNEAKRLLAMTELSVSEIADSVGFKSVLDFSKFFSTGTGISPTGYRATHR